jgi:hypothetical protein
MSVNPTSSGVGDQRSVRTSQFSDGLDGLEDSTAAEAACGATAVVCDEMAGVASVEVGDALIGDLGPLGAKCQKIQASMPTSTVHTSSLRIIGHSHHESSKSDKIETVPVYTHGWKKF